MTPVSAELLTLGSLTEEDTRNYTEWVTSIPNKLDVAVTGYPRTVMARAKAGDEPIAYVALQPVLMYESLAPKPGVSSLQVAQALQSINEATDEAGKMCGFGEAYFLTDSESEMKLCTKRGWIVTLYDPERKTWLLKHRIYQVP